MRTENKDAKHHGSENTNTRRGTKKDIFTTDFTESTDKGGK
jgi:hypothetical protein